MSEPTPFRDNGPYQSADQAMQQFAAVTFGVPLNTTEKTLMVLNEALLLTNARPSAFESEYLRVFQEERGLDPLVAQILAGAIIRAYLTGMNDGAVLDGQSTHEAADTSVKDAISDE